MFSCALSNEGLLIVYSMTETAFSMCLPECVINLCRISGEHEEKLFKSPFDAVELTETMVFRLSSYKGFHAISIAAFLSFVLTYKSLKRVLC